MKMEENFKDQSQNQLQEHLLKIEKIMSEWKKDKDSNLTGKSADSKEYEKERKNKFRNTYFTIMLPACNLFLDAIKNIDTDKKIVLKNKLTAIYNKLHNEIKPFLGNKIPEECIDEMDKAAVEIIELFKKDGIAKQCAEK